MTSDDPQRGDDMSEAELGALREAIAASLASGPDIPADEVFDRLEARYLALWLASEASK